jgi:hypothetical protein
MRAFILAAAVAALTCSFASSSYAQSAQQELMKSCNRDASAKKLKGPERKSFMSECLAGNAAQSPQLTAQQQRMKDCNAGAAGMSASKRKAYMSSCLSGNSTTASAPSGTSSSPATNRPEPRKETTGTAPRDASQNSAPSGNNGSVLDRWLNRDSRSTTGSAGDRAAAPGQHSSEAVAKMSCGDDAVVWVNSDSKIYHFKSSRSYGNTKAGGYMCERDARSAGSRAAKNEKRS